MGRDNALILAEKYGHTEIKNLINFYQKKYKLQNQFEKNGNKVDVVCIILRSYCGSKHNVFTGLKKHNKADANILLNKFIAINQSGFVSDNLQNIKDLLEQEIDRKNKEPGYNKKGTYAVYLAACLGTVEKEIRTLKSAEPVPRDRARVKFR